MIPNQEKTVSITGNVQNSRQMGLDASSLPHLMSVLSSLYSDAEMAVIREYSTNAYDSHVAAGKGDVPIQVKLPSVFSPEFSVRDFGVGMSEAEVFEVFGMYGASTKRESNDYVGQLGLGCKSAFAFTNQFSLTAIKDNVKAVFSVHLDELGVGTITKMHEELTESGNGVEINIPVREVNSFNDKAKRFFRFFPVMPTFVGGVAFPEEMVPEVILEVDDKTKIIKRHSHDGGKDYVVMGGVAYPNYRSYNDLGAINVEGTVVMYADIGEVDFTPSREELNYNHRTKEFIRNRFEDIRDKLTNKIQFELANAKSLAHYANIVKAFRSEIRNLGITDLKFEGQPISLFSSEAVIFPEGSFILETDYNGRVYTKSTNTSIRASTLPHRRLVRYGTDSDIPKVKRWMKENNYKDVIIMLKNSWLHEEYLGKFIEEVSIDDIKVKTAKSKKTTQYDKVSVNYYDNLGFSLSQPDTTKRILFAVKTQIKSAHRVFSQVFKELDSEKYEVYALNKNQVNSFKKSYPQAVSMNEEILKIAKEKLSEWHSNEINVYSSLSLPYNDFTHLRLPKNHEAIEDKELAVLVKEVNMAQGVYGRPNKTKPTKFQSFLNHFGASEAHELMTFSSKYDSIISRKTQSLVERMKKLREKYPLLLSQNAQEEELLNYANIIAKGE